MVERRSKEKKIKGNASESFQTMSSTILHFQPPHSHPSEQQGTMWQEKRGIDWCSIDKLGCSHTIPSQKQRARGHSSERTALETQLSGVPKESPENKVSTTIRYITTTVDHQSLVRVGLEGGYRSGIVATPYGFN